MIISLLKHLFLREISNRHSRPSNNPQCAIIDEIHRLRTRTASVQVLLDQLQISLSFIFRLQDNRLVLGPNNLTNSRQSGYLD